jgi:transposase InsO family protein
MWTRHPRLQPANLHPRHFDARYVGQLWHTDLHQLHPEKNPPGGGLHDQHLIVFLDDRSRYVIYYEVLDDKTMKSTSQALRTALDLFPKPHQLTSDNGGEFTGRDFQAILDAEGIGHWLTAPYTPQHNGKMERFWGTVEGTISEYRFMGEAIDEYNRECPHSALQRLSATHDETVPEEAWENWEHWEGHDDLDIVYR